MTGTQIMIQELTESDQDFEWYPTTQEIIDCVKSGVALEGHHKDLSVLDCGAGDGRVLMGLTDGDRYAIEKAEPLINALDPSIFVIGTDFLQQTLIDKKVDVIFSNPPYSEYELWAEKIIREANSAVVVLVIPERWKDSERVQEAIKVREGRAKVIGSFDFLKADRAARAKVDVLRIRLDYDSGYRYGSAQTDPFSLWFNSNFEMRKDTDSGEKLSERVKAETAQNEIVGGGGLIPVLETLYQRDMGELLDTYKALCAINPRLLKEIGGDVKSVREAFRLKIEGLKNLYWRELFDNLSKITDRLTSKTRGYLLSTLTSNTSVDFTAQNAYAVVVWVLKQANQYYDDQLVEVFRDMTEKANVINYKSNKKTFEEERWRYRCRDEWDHYTLDYRIVLTRTGGIHTGSWRHDSINGLSKRAADLLDDINTVAYNLGFDVSLYGKASQFEWESGKKNNFLFDNTANGKTEILFEAKAFKNGNMHLKFHKEFIMRLNVEIGRLKGWINTPNDAADEMGISLSSAKRHFRSNLQLTAGSVPLLLTNEGSAA